VTYPTAPESVHDHAARIARLAWARIVGCEHDFRSNTQSPVDLCVGCGATRAMASLVAGYARRLAGGQ
jgi:hypothetical protein